MSAATRAFAQPASAPGSDASRTEARARFEEGLALHDAGHDDEARLKFAQAYALLANPNILFNLARSEELSSHLVDAITHFKAYDRDTTIAPADHDTARKHIAEIARVIGHVRVEAPDGARVAVDGAPLDAPAPLADVVDVMPGKHVVEATFDGASHRVEVSPNGGETVPARFTSGEAAVAPLPAPSVTAPAPGPVAPLANDDASPHDANHSFWTPRNSTAVLLGAGAVVAIGVGVVFSAAAANDSGKADDAKSQVLAARGPTANPTTVCAGSVATSSPDCQTWHDAARSGVTDRNFATGFFVGGGVLAVAAVVTLVAWPERRGAGVSPAVGLGGAGIAGRFW